MRTTPEVRDPDAWHATQIMANTPAQSVIKPKAEETFEQQIWQGSRQRRRRDPYDAKLALRAPCAALHTKMRVPSRLLRRIAGPAMT